jgi:hypothetical protein
MQTVTNKKRDREYVHLWRIELVYAKGIYEDLLRKKALVYRYLCFDNTEIDRFYPIREGVFSSCSKLNLYIFNQISLIYHFWLNTKMNEIELVDEFDTILYGIIHL